MTHLDYFLVGVWIGLAALVAWLVLAFVVWVILTTIAKSGRSW
jgi:hypothetical protein